MQVVAAGVRTAQGTRMDDLDSMSATLRRNLDRLAERRQREARSLPLTERIGRAIGNAAGSMTFVLVHLTILIVWIVVNLGWLPVVPRFDPSFIILASAASVEAIFLSTFVLMTQNHMAEDANRRDELDLHTNLLAEHELTRLARLIAQIAEKLGIPADDAAMAEVKRDVEPETVLDAIEARRDE